MRLLFFFLVCLMTAPLSAKGVKIGTVVEIKGAPDILRFPVRKLTESIKAKAKAEGFAIAKYRDRFWQSHVLKNGSALYYGDVLDSGSQSKMHITMDDGFAIVLAKNTRVRLTKAFVRSQEGGAKNWIHLINGKLRAIFHSEGGKTAQTEFRTNSLAMGVRGTDFVIQKTPTETEVITFSGKVEARKVSPKEAESVANLADLDLDEGNEAQIEQVKKQASQAIDAAPKEVVTIESGQKVAIKEPPPAAKVEEMRRTMKPEAFAEEMQSYSLREPEKANVEDLKSYQAITADMQLQQETKDDPLEKLIAEEEKPEPKQPAPKQDEPHSGMFAGTFAIGGWNYSATYEDKEYKASTEADVHLNAEWRAWTNVALGMGIINSDWVRNDWAKIGSAQDARSDRFTTYYLNGIYHYRTGNWRFGLNLMMVAAQSWRINFVHEANGNSQTTEVKYHMNSHMRIGLQLLYQFWRKASFYFQLTGGGGTMTSSQGKIRETDADNPLFPPRTMEGGVGGVNFGLNWELR